MGRNLVILCDGTNNDVTGDETNVLRLFRILRRTPEQLVYYDAGVGTMGDPQRKTRFGRLLGKWLDSAIGHTLRDNFCSAYRFLVRNYQEGDRISFFGFSRGAYTVRAVAGALKMFGLVRPDHENLVPHVWSIYSNDARAHAEDARFGGAARLKKLFSRPVPIHFVGAFDTVSSLGWIWDYRALPYTANNPSIAHVRHAVSIDERRAGFRQNAVGFDGNSTLEQVWFPGVHSDVGGGYREDEGGLSKLALRWMLGEARGQGLDLDLDEAKRVLFGGVPGSQPDAVATKHGSLTIAWWILEFLPRRTAKGWRGPNFFRSRKLRPVAGLSDEVRLHWSVGARKQAGVGYDPRNVRKVANSVTVQDLPVPGLDPTSS